jgi:hypothetical protein
LIERLETTAVQTVRCTLCGWRISREVTPTTYQRFEPEPVKKAGRPAGLTGSAPCSVLGCPARPYANAPWGMCAQHRKTMKAWQESAGRYSCPFKEIPEGGYIQLSRSERRKRGSFKL